MNAQVDSLRQMVEGDIPAAQKIEVYPLLVDALIEEGDSAAAMKYIRQGVALAEEERKAELRSKEGYLLFRTGHYAEAQAIYEAELVLSRQQGWELLASDCLNMLGKIYYNQSSYDTALTYLTESMNGYKTLENHKKLGRSYFDVGRVHLHRGDNQRALELFEQGLAISKAAGDEKNLIRGYNDIAIVYGGLRDLATASDYFHKALVLAEATQILDGLSQTYSNLAVLYNIKRDYKQSEDYRLKALAISVKQNSRIDIGIHLNSLGQLANNQGNIEKSLMYYDSAIVLFDALGHDYHKENSYSAQADIYKQQGDTAAAIIAARNALAISARLEDISSMAFNTKALGLLYLEQYEEDSAFYYFDRTLRLFEEGGNSYQVLNTLGVIGNFYSNQGNLPRAISFYQRVLDQAEEDQDTLILANAYSYLADLYSEQGDEVTALVHYEQAMTGFEAMQDKARVADMQEAIAGLLLATKRYKEAIEASTAALHTYQQLNDSCSFGAAYLTLSRAYKGLTQADSADYFIKKALDNALQCENLKTSLLASVYGDIGALYLEQGNEQEALFAYERALTYATRSQNRAVMKVAAAALYPMYEQKGLQDKAYETFKVFHASSDSLFNEKNTRALVQQQYEKELQKQALVEQQQEAELARQEWINYGMVGAFLGMLAIALAVYRNYRNKYKANRLLEAKNAEISQQQAKLKALDHAKSRFFANVSHELRTPLTLISGPLQNLTSRAGTDFSPEIQSDLRLMEHNTKKLKSLVNDILNLSRLESNKLDLKESTVRVEHLLLRVFDSLRSLADRLEIDYQAEIDALPASHLMLDADKVERVLVNLLSNAIKFTPGGGSITMTAGEKDGQLCIEVRDTGQGIPAGDLPYIFDRYYQSKQPDAPLQGGSGIGLALAKEYTQVMGGQLCVASTYGEGSTFTLCLPYKEAAAAAESTEVLREEVAVASADRYDTPEKIGALIEKRHHVLIVEDHPEMSQFIKGLLSKHYQVAVAMNGKKALEHLAKHPVDLIVSDVMMPEMDGFALLSHLREDERYMHIPVILLTALGDEAHKIEALSMGVDDYLAKPFSAPELIARISNMLSRYELRKLLLHEDEEQKEGSAAGDERMSPQQVNARGKTFVQKVEERIVAELENEEFSLEKLAEEFFLSYSHFGHKVKKLTGLSPKKLQQEIALQTGRRLLEENRYGNLTAVAQSVGIRNVTQFKKLYIRRFGNDPMAYFEEIDQW